MVALSVDMLLQQLVNIYITMKNNHILNGKTHHKNYGIHGQRPAEGLTWDPPRRPNPHEAL